MFPEKSTTLAPMTHRAPKWPWLLVPAFLTIFLMILIRRAAVSVPFADELHFNTLYRYLVEGRIPPVSELLATHNGHPYLFLKLIITAIFSLHLPWKLLMYAQPLFLAWTFFIVARAACLGVNTLRDALTYIALAACIISPRIWEDLYWGMQLSAQMCLAFSLLSFSLTANYISDRSNRNLILVFISAVAAAMSAGAGIIVPPMVVAAICFVPGNHQRSHVIASCIFLALSSALTFLCFRLSTEPGVGGKALQLGLGGEHVLRMLAHLYIDLPVRSMAALWLGVSTGLILTYVGFKLLSVWPQHIFAILCALLGAGLIVMITYARIKVGLFQPNAPRYVPAVLPLSIGLLLLLRSLEQKLLLVALASLACIGFMQAATSQWIISPYYKANLNALKTGLCQEGKAADSSTTEQIADMRKLFCESHK
jgi:hypothetical protein